MTGLHRRDPQRHPHRVSRVIRGERTSDDVFLAGSNVVRSDSFDEDRQLRLAITGHRSAGSPSRRPYRDPDFEGNRAVDPRCDPSDERSIGPRHCRASREFEQYSKARVQQDESVYRAVSTVAVLARAPRNPRLSGPLRQPHPNTVGCSPTGSSLLVSVKRDPIERFLVMMCGLVPRIDSRSL